MIRQAYRLMMRENSIQYPGIIAKHYSVRKAVIFDPLLHLKTLHDSPRLTCATKSQNCEIHFPNWAIIERVRWRPHHGPDGPDGGDGRDVTICSQVANHACCFCALIPNCLVFLQILRLQYLVRHALRRGAFGSSCHEHEAGGSNVAI